MTSIDSLPLDRPLFRQELKDRVKSQVVRAATEQGILLVRTSDLPSEGLLSERQRGWVNSAPYDSRTENPVLYKHAVDSSKPSQISTVRDEAKQEVQSLPDIVSSPLHVEGGVGVRLKEARKERHESTIQDMKQELAAISSEFEVQIQSAIDLSKSQQTHSDTVIASLFEQISTPELLGSQTMSNLHALWSEISDQGSVRQASIETLDSSLTDLENQRSTSVTEVLHGYALMLEKIAFLLPPDVHRLIEEEAHLVNMAILANRKTYSELCIQLLASNFSRERDCRDRWESVLTDWSDLVVHSTLCQYQYFLSSSHIQDSPDLNRLKDHLAAQQRGINKRREGLLSEIATLAPPKATKSYVYELKANADKLQQQLESVHTNYLLQCQSCLEGLSRDCEEEIDKYKDHLVSSGALESSTVHKVLSRLFVPLMERETQRLREELQSVEKSLDTTLYNQKALFDSLFDYLQGAALLWDQHTDSLATSQRAFQERLDGCRSGHDRENQNLEANLDLLLDRLRQEPTQESLTNYLEEALRMLETIKQGYESFHVSVVEEIQSYPNLVKADLDVYDSAICNYLGVSRSPMKKSKSKLTLSRTPSEMARSDSRTKSRKPKPVRSKTTASGLATTKGSSGSLSAIVEEVISTSGGSSFYIQRSKQLQTEAVFLTQDEESETVTFATENISLPQEKFDRAKEKLCLSFLDQLEKWKTNSMGQAEATVSSKDEEAHTELDLRLHLHEPRPSRVEQDIHNVRLTELVAHRDRITRHSTGLTTSLSLQRGSGERLKESLSTEGQEFFTQIEELTKDLTTCTKTKELLALQTKAKEKCTLHLDAVSRLSSEGSAGCESVLEQLGDSNTAYRTSIKLFSDGGNYCPEEVELYTKKLDKLSIKLSSTQSHIRSEMESVTSQQVTASQEALDNFENVFNLHLADLSFLESISRTLTSAQVKIKSEVAASNTQAQIISDHISELKAKVDNAGKSRKVSSSSEIVSLLPSLFDLLTQRTDYLYCRASQLQGSRVGGHSEVVTSSSSGTKPIGAMNVTKSIIEHVSVARQPSDGMSKVPDTTNRGNEQRLSTSVKSDDHQRGSGRQSRRKTVSSVERRNVNFGIGGGDNRSFLPRIRTVLKAMHSDLYAKTETYYKGKGSRPSTRPSDIQENFESCMDVLIIKGQCYRSQAEDYRNNCIEEFHVQLCSLMSVLECVPSLTFSDLLSQWRATGREQRQTAKTAHDKIMEDHVNKKSFHSSSLRPGLGHPSQSEVLQILCSQEEQRHKDSLSHILAHSESLRDKENSNLQLFVAELTDKTKSLLALLDTVTSDADVIPGDGKSKERQSIEDLLREQVHKPCPSMPTKVPAPVTRVVWPPLPNTQITKPSEAPIVCRVQSNNSKRRVSHPIDQTQQRQNDSTNDKLVSKKSTSAHEVVIRERDAVFNAYCKEFHIRLEEISQRELEERSSEVKWYKNWTQSLDTVKQLYS